MTRSTTSPPTPRSKAAALALANYVALYKDAAVLGENVIKGVDWVLGGTSGTCRSTRTCTADEIRRPSSKSPRRSRSTPTTPPISGNRHGHRGQHQESQRAGLLQRDLCQAGARRVAHRRHKKVVNGYSHTPALPCEVSIWNDDEHIYVDMLDPNAIFSLFFTDVLFSADMADPPSPRRSRDLPPQVKSEIRAVVLHAMNEFDAKTKTVDKQLGPKFKNMDQVVDVVANSPYQSPYKHVGYTKVDGSGVHRDRLRQRDPGDHQHHEHQRHGDRRDAPDRHQRRHAGQHPEPRLKLALGARHPDDPARQQPRDRSLLAQVRQDGHGHRRAPCDRAALRDHRADHRQGRQRQPWKRW